MPFLTPLTGRQGWASAPQRKPWGNRARYELDLRAPLIKGLLMAIVPDGPMGVGGMIDYATPSRTFAATGGTPTFSAGQFGNQVNCGFGTSTAITFTPTLPAPASAFTFTALIFFDGSGHGDGGFALLSDGVASNEVVSVQTSLNSPLSVGGGTGTHADSAALFLALLSGWHRIGCSYDGTTSRFYLDGKTTDTSAAFSGNLGAGALSQIFADTGQGSFSWGWNVADMFYWNRTLTDTEVLRNYVAPYKSVLRPKFSDLGTVGPAIVPKKGALMLQGVG